MDDKEILVKLSALTQGGSSIGPIVSGPEELINKKAFVPFTIPGETALVTISKDKGSFCEAELVKISESVDSRTIPSCPYFQTCGGCQLQHIELKAQRQLKYEMVQSALKVKGIIPPNPAVLIGEDLPGFSYRRRVSLHMSAAGAIGFYKTGSSEVVDIEQCLISNSVINHALAIIRKFKSEIKGLIAGILIEDNQAHPNVIFKTGYSFSKNKLEYLSDIITNHFSAFAIEKDDRVLFSNIAQQTTGDSEQLTGHFSQVNPEANQLLVQTVSKLIEADNIDDLYSGSGNLCWQLAQKGKIIRAIEIDGDLVEHGRQLASNLGVSDNISFINLSAEKFVKTNSLSQAVILDPPRSGAKLVCQAISAKDTKQIVYVSCNLPNFVRDAQTLLAKGYKLNQLFVLDMFAQTYHVEIIGEFI